MLALVLLINDLEMGLGVAVVLIESDFPLRSALAGRSTGTVPLLILVPVIGLDTLGAIVIRSVMVAKNVAYLMNVRVV